MQSGMSRLLLVLSIASIVVASVTRRQDGPSQTSIGLASIPEITPQADWEEPAISAAISHASSIISAQNLEEHPRPSQRVEQILAIGDSYTAGVGSNGHGDLQYGSYSCARFNRAWPMQLVESEEWNDFNVEAPVLNFGACTGATMDGLWRHQVQPGEEWRDVEYHTFGRPELAVLTISGNDVNFGSLANDCIYHASPNGGDCETTLRDTETLVRSDDFQTRLIDILSRIAIRGRTFGNARPASSFQVFISGYVHFWNHDDPACDRVNWNFWAWWGERGWLTRRLRRRMNDLVDDLNRQIQIAARSLEGIGVYYVDGFQADYATHRFCEPEEDNNYHWSPTGARTWFWHPSAVFEDPDEGPEIDAEIELTNMTQTTQYILDLLIPDPEVRTTLGPDNPPWNINPAFLYWDTMWEAVRNATREGRGDDVHERWAVPPNYLRSLHPKGTAYGHHMRQFMRAIRASREPVDWSPGITGQLEFQEQNQD